MKKIWILTLFPEYFTPLKEYGVVGQALRGERGREFELNFVQIRDFSPKDYKGVDDAPYGGGAGMVMRADVLKEAYLKGVIEAGNYGGNFREKISLIYTSPRGRSWDNQISQEFSKKYFSQDSKDVAFLCGRYEGVDERFLENYVDETFSLGDFVLSGGEIAVMAFLDSTLRFSEGTLGNRESHKEESFMQGALEHPHYTRPRVFEDKEVPEVLLSGHHKRVSEWREKKAKEITRRYRPDLKLKDSK